MNISQNSWHFKFMRYWGGQYSFEYPRTLCAYFWTFVGSVIKAIFCTLAAAFAALLLPLLFWSWLANGSTQASAALSVIFGGTGLLFGVGYLCFGLSKLQKYFRKIHRDENAGLLRIIVGMVVATKQKVCPFIEYKE
jgi:hypothetical protein